MALAPILVSLSLLAFPLIAIGTAVFAVRVVQLAERPTLSWSTAALIGFFFAVSSLPIGVWFGFAFGEALGLDSGAFR